MNERTGKLVDVIVGLVAIWYSLPQHARTELHARAWHVTAHQASRGALVLHSAAEQLGRLSIVARQRYYRVVQS